MLTQILRGDLPIMVALVLPVSTTPVPIGPIALAASVGRALHSWPGERSGAAGAAWRGAARVTTLPPGYDRSAAVRLGRLPKHDRDRGARLGNRPHWSSQRRTHGMEWPPYPPARVVLDSWVVLPLIQITPVQPASPPQLIRLECGCRVRVSGDANLVTHKVWTQRVQFTDI